MTKLNALILSSIIWITAFGWFIYIGDWKILVGVILLLWANNIQQNYGR